MKPLVTALALLASASCLGACAATPSAPRPDAAASAEGSQVVCRERLVPGSNQHHVVCLTRDQWTAHERNEAIAAAALVQRFQGSAYNTVP